MHKAVFTWLVLFAVGSTMGCRSLLLPPPRSFRLVYEPWRPTDETWITARWVADDARLVELRQRIDAAVKRGAVTPATIQTYERIYHESPSEMSYFRWAYTATKAGYRVYPWIIAHTLATRVDKSLAQSPQPYSREFARLRFLSEASAFPNGRLAVLGERLLVSAPDDRTVKAQTAFLISLSRSFDDKAKGLKYAQELLADYPSEPKYHDLVGRCYDSFCWLTKNPEYAAKAIAEYKIFQRSLSPRDDDRRMIDLKIKRLQSGGGPESGRREMSAVSKAKP